jgi:hypothetical protein
MNRRLSPGTLWFFTVAAAALLPWLEILLDTDAVLLFRDLTNVYIPVKATWVRGVLELGRIPHWDPFHQGGRPFFPDINGSPFYPLNLLLLPFGPDNTARGLVFYIAAHHLLLATGGFLLFRKLRCRPPVAAAGACALAWCGFAFSANSLIHELAGAAAMPFFFLGLLMARDARTAAKGIVIASMALAAAVYSGNVQMGYVACLAAPAVLWRHSFGRALCQTAAIAALAALAAGPQLGPTLSYLGQATREFERAGPEAHYAFQTAWSLHPARLFELVFPFAFAPPGHEPGWAQTFINASNATLPFIFSNYACAALGAPLLALLPAWLMRARKWSLRRWLLVVQALAVALLTLGAFSPIPLYRLAVTVLPLWDRFRYPERLVFWVSLAWIVFSVLALERLVRLRRPSRLKAAFPLGAGVFLLALATFCTLAAHNAGASAVHGTLSFFAALAALWVPGFRYRSHAVLAIVALDLFLVSRSLLWPQSAELVRLENLAYVKQVAENLAQEHEAVPAGAAGRVFVQEKLHGLPMRPGVKPMDAESAGKWGMLLFNTNSYWGIESPSGYFALQIGQTLLDRFPEPKHFSRIIDLLSVRYLLHFAPEGNSVHVNSTALPFASVPASQKFVTSLTEAHEQILYPGWRYADSVILEAPPGTSGPGGWKVAAVSKRFDRIDIRLTNERIGKGGWLLVNEAFSTNWRAHSGEAGALPIIRANGWAMAVALPPARDGQDLSVDLRYVEPSLRWGLGAFAIWLIAAGFLLTWPWRAHRKRGHA